jgi:hypothetical protein
MADAAAHLVEEVLPEVPVRQSVCTLPWASRKRAGYKRALCIDISEAFFASLTTELRQRGKRHLPDVSHDQSLSFLTDRSVCRRSPMSDADRRRSPSSPVTITASSTSAAFAAHVLVCVHYACTVHALCMHCAGKLRIVEIATEPEAPRRIAREERRRRGEAVDHGRALEARGPPQVPPRPVSKWKQPSPELLGA